MKKLIMLSVLLLSANVAMAQSAESNVVSSQNSTVRNTTSTATVAPVTSQTYSTVQNDSHDVVQGTDLSRAVGMATAPALTTTLTETCMGSTSAGAGFSGGSFSFGTTWRDTECVNRLNAREIRTYGDVQAAKEIMCSNDTVREAFKKVGRPCADDGGIYTVAAPAPAAVVEQAPAAPVVGTDKKVGDESDEMAKRTQMMLDEAERSAASIRSKGL
ncbi:MAG: hypothetical protein CTY12_07860 [Methylotenera sp.]|nr:MAG: hypothetical protein CTY12_07860 [Methylotenera sp.]